MRLRLLLRAFLGFLFQFVERRRLRRPLRGTGRDSVFPDGGQFIELMASSGGNLRIVARLQPFENRLRRLPFLGGFLNLPLVKYILLISWTERDRFLHGIHRRSCPSTLHACHRQQVVGFRKFRVPVQRDLQVDHHVGEALHLFMIRLRGFVLHQRKIIAVPYIVRIQSCGVAQLLGRLRELLLLDMHPS